MGLIFVPSFRETLRKSFQRVSAESTSGGPSVARGNSSNDQSYQSLEDLVRIYDNPDSSEPDILDPDSESNPEGEAHHSGSDSPATEQGARVPGDHTLFFPLRRPTTATPGSMAVSSVDRRTVRLLEVLSAYYVRSAYDRARASNTIPPPPPTASTSTGATSSPSSPSSSVARGLSLLQSTPPSSNILSRPAPAVPERNADSLARVYDVNRSTSSQTEEWDPDTRSSQFIFGPDTRGMSTEELRLSHWHNGPLTFHSNDDQTDSNGRRSRVVNPRPGLVRAREQRPDDELIPSVRRRTYHLSSASMRSSSSSTGDPSSGGVGGGLFGYSSNTDRDSESAPQAFLWHNETRTNVTTHGCLRVIMRRHQGWEEQAAQNGFLEYWHYSTVPHREPTGFEVVRDGVARLPWPMLSLAELHTLRTFAYQVNSVHHRDTPTTEYHGNVFDVILVPSMQVTLGVGTEI